jgi:predicted HicB family RNase H-like nuclease
MIDRMEYGAFIGSVHYSAKDDLLFGKIEGINDLVTFEGGSVKELRKSFKEAVEDYLSLQPLT